jgi:hypothetical protein
VIQGNPFNESPIRTVVVVVITSNTRLGSRKTPCGVASHAKPCNEMSIRPSVDGHSEVRPLFPIFWSLEAPVPSS